MSNKRVWKTILIICALFVFWQAGTVSAANTRNVGFTIGCSGFESRGSIIYTNRDNTGNNQESFTITAYDGVGQVIYSETNTFVVGGGFVIAAGEFKVWSQTPMANPLIVTISSNGGNGLEQQVVYRRSGECALLTQEGNFSPQLIGLPEIGNVDGSTSPSTPIGQVPPTPAGLNDVADLLDLPGYAIVNTSRLNMRTGAGAGFTRIAILDGGTELIVLGKNPAETWWYVQVDDLRGWVSGEFIALRGDVRGAHILPSEGEPEPARFILYNNYPLYNGPSDRAGSLCTVAGNIENLVVGRSANSDWFQIQTTCNGATITGWVQAELGAFRSSGAVSVPVTG